jgi:hypothetical protein
MRAVLLRQLELRDQLRPTLNNGREGWNDDEPAVVQVACETIVRRYFGPGYDVRAVAGFVDDLREATNDDGRFSRLKTEAVIRTALGEANVDTSGIKKGERFNTHLIAIALASRRLEFNDKDVDQLIIDAEQVAFDRGWHPPLAD